jgi:hypothetical protein
MQQCPSFVTVLDFPKSSFGWNKLPSLPLTAFTSVTSLSPKMPGLLIHNEKFPNRFICAEIRI